MVRKRGTARKSFAHRRVRRVKKYDHVVIPRRFKIQLPDLSDRIEEALKEYVELEPYVEAELIVKGVPTNQWQYLHGFAKRMLALYLNFTGETLQKEKQSLINEYVLRGFSLNVLEQEQDVVEKYVVPPLNCAEVKACLEGDYTSYAIIASFDDVDSVANYRAQDAVFNADEDKIVILDIENITIKTYDITTAILGAAIATDMSEYVSGAYDPHYPKKSILGTYLVVLGYTASYQACDRIRILKDGAQIQTLTDTDLGLQDDSIRNVAMSATGKYIIVSGRRTASGNMGWVLLQGS